MTDTASVPAFLDTHLLPDDAAAASARLAAGDAAVRRIALLDLADLEDAALVPAFVAVLRDDPAAEVRREAAGVLAAWEQRDVVEALCNALLDTDSDVRDAAARSLSELKDPSSGQVLRRWAERPEPAVRRAVLRGLRELRYADALDPALRALADANDDVRLEAVGVLGWLKDPRALAPLAKLAIDAAGVRADVRGAAVGALGFATHADTAVTSALLDALRDDAWQVREQAATTLGKLRLQAARDPLITALDDAYWQVRLRAVRALGQLKDRHAAPKVAALLMHTISNLRKEAALALGELNDADTLPALRTALQDGDPEVRKAARIAIQQMEGSAR
ncbi:HEAT repeat domain-containing protein [Paraburkholderia solisilvae]|uniref:Uncharacterized protein n=1 Tax=Paraburkholderia solisilvae TaxID=624376 RepID=A0A6J5DKP9_9BURK|nr:HEAT repeat domain-containing protein [Paraburkholderia solisilvae]CAB3754017.1 hypothetical protein LMG29739_01863 [Paraburkholderia solisilvae]